MRAEGAGPVQQATAAAVPDVEDHAAVRVSLLHALDEVTVEEFRLSDFRCESDARLGRRLLYLLSNTEWVRRTTENVEIGRARVVDTEVVVDVDLSYLPAAVLDEDTVWLPVLAVPPPARDPGGGDQRDPVTSMEVTDAAGARVGKAPQSQVQRQLAAALAELVLGRLPRSRPVGGAGPGRDEHVLLTAALRRLLPGTALPDDLGDDGTGTPVMLERGRAQVEERLIVARTGLVHALSLDAQRPRPVLASRLAEMLAALVGIVIAVVPVPADVRPTSFAVRLPGRRLVQDRRRPRWTSARAHLRVDLHAASPHSDRVVHLGLPDGIAVPAAPPAGAPPAGARIVLTGVRPVEELRALLQLVLDGDPEPAWVRRRLAGLAVDKVETSLEALDHLRTTVGTHDPAPRLRTLRSALLDVAAQDGAAAVASLQQVWADGGWLPTGYERRLVVNTAAPGLVHVRASAIEGSAQRATTRDAAIDADVEVSDSTVVDGALDMSALTLAFLAVMTVLLVAVRQAGALRPEILATVLTLFPAVLVSRVERPDRSTLRGVLSEPTYLLSLATVLPPVLLAALLAVAADRPVRLALASVAVLSAQLALHITLRRVSRARGAPALLLRTEHPPDLSRLDVLRGTWCRTLVADAVLLGRLTQGYLVAGPDTPGALDRALDVTLGAGIDEDGRRTSATSVHGLFHACAAGRSVTFVLAGGPTPDGGRRDPGGGRSAVRPVPVDPGRLSAVEPPAWIVEVFVGLVPGRLDALAVEDHPVSVLLAAARTGDLPVLLVQTPALPPTYAAEQRDWLRVRVGVPFLPGEDLGRLASYLTALDGLRQRHPARGAARVHVYAVPEFATHQASQTAPDEADLAGRRTTDVLRDIAPEDVALPPDAPGTQALGICAWARVGLAADVLQAAASTGPTRLVAMTSVVLHGLAAHLVVLAPLPDDGAADGADGAARPAFADAVRGALHPRDVVETVPAGASAGTGRPGRDDAAAATGPRSVVRLQVRVPERPHALRGLLGDVADLVGGLDTWFALFRVADGRSVQGRLMARVARPGADAVRDGAGRRDGSLQRAVLGREAAHRRTRSTVEDDPVVDLAVLRTTAP